MNQNLRIVSLIASATEIVCALGYRHCIVGRSHECDYPGNVSELPCCTAPKFRTDGTSRDINRRVEEMLRDALSVYTVDGQLIDTLQPTHIITQTQCEVCAVSLKDVQAAACTTISSSPQIVALEPNTLNDVFDDIMRVALSLNDRAAGERLVSEMKGRIGAVKEKARLVPRRKTAFVEWIEPLLPGGNWMPELIVNAGGTDCFCGDLQDGHVSVRNFEDLLAAQPDVIVIAPCGFDIQRTRQEMHWLAEHHQWCQLPAVRAGRVFIADGNQYFNRPGPRLVDSLEILAEVMHPELFNFGHRGTGWVPFNAGLATSDTRA